MNTLLAQFIGAVLRHLLTGVSAYFVAKGILTESQAGEMLTALIVFLLSVIWSLYQKHRSKLAFAIALESPPGVTAETVARRMPSPISGLRSMSVFLVLLAVIVSAACAARGPRNVARVGALTATEAALGLDQLERDLYSGSVYDKAKHDQLGKGVTKILYAVRGYERAVLQWKEGQSASQAVTDARKGVLDALADFEKIIPGVDAVRGPFKRAIEGIKAAMNTPPAEAQLRQLMRLDQALRARAVGELPVQRSEMPGGGILAILAFAQLAARLLQSGRTTWEKLLEALKKEGATDEELNQADLRLTAAIAAREAEHGVSE